MSSSDILKDTPTWFRKLITPLIVGILIAVPLTTNWASVLGDVTDIEKGLVELTKRIERLERKEESIKEVVQGYEVKQAVMAEQVNNMDEKLDRLLIIIERN